MHLLEARILLQNLLGRIELTGDGTGRLAGVLTLDELSCLRTAIDILDGKLPPTAPAGGAAVAPVSSDDLTESQPTERQAADGAGVPPSLPAQKGSVCDQSQLKLDLSTLSLPAAPTNVRLCLDFGTAMSKATLVVDSEHTGSEQIHVLKLGVPGNQEEISEVMLMSSVYIDDQGTLWFGKAAVDRSMIEGADGSRQRLDNIKRRLSEEGWEEPVGTRFNPTALQITHGDLVLAYLAYFTWTVNVCLEELGYPRNMRRRFAMPCLSGAKGRETAFRLRRLVGQAQILSDTFGASLREGIPLSEFCSAISLLGAEKREYPYVGEDITEPLGVAGSIMSWKSYVDNLVLVIDVGAGTSDISLYRLHYEPDSGNSIAVEIRGSSRVLTEAGNYLDRLLIEQIIKKSGVTSDDPVWINTRSALELQIRDLKESLFNDEYVFVSLINDTEVEVELEEFLQLDAVRRFEQNLRETVASILDSVDESWVKWIKANPSRKLVVALTGGGSELPMVRSLANGTIVVKGIEVPIQRALHFPTWLRDIDENLEDDYPRVAVSLGGARKRIIERGEAARITAGDILGVPVLEGYYQKGV